jgi:hypothetical protein
MTGAGLSCMGSTNSKNLVSTPASCTKRSLIKKKSKIFTILPVSIFFPGSCIEIHRHGLPRCVQTRYPAANCVIYTGDVDAAPDQIIAKAMDR